MKISNESCGGRGKLEGVLDDLNRKNMKHIGILDPGSWRLRMVIEIRATFTTKLLNERKEIEL